MVSIQGKRVLVTGAASGIGLATAQQFARHGAEIIATDINEEALALAVRSIRKCGAKVHTFAYDVGKQAQVDKMAAQVLSKLGPVDILINNAGIGYSGELEDTTLVTWRKLVDVNLLGPIYHVHAFLPDMKSRHSGQIVNVSSGQAFFRLPTWGAYASIKAALGCYSEILHFELHKHGIHVTTVYPFMVHTPFYKQIKAETWGTKLSMKLVPYYSMKPETVAKIIFNAVRNRRRVELVSLINNIGVLTHLLPIVPDAMAMAATYVLGKHVGKRK